VSVYIYTRAAAAVRLAVILYRRKKEKKKKCNAPLMDWNAADRWATFRRIKKRNVCIYPILVDDGHSLHTRSFFLSPLLFLYEAESIGESSALFYASSVAIRSG
jgi:hypothetical protein